MKAFQFDLFNLNVRNVFKYFHLSYVLFNSIILTWLYVFFSKVDYIKVLVIEFEKLNVVKNLVGNFFRQRRIQLRNRIFSEISFGSSHDISNLISMPEEPSLWMWWKNFWFRKLSVGYWSSWRQWIDRVEVLAAERISRLKNKIMPTVDFPQLVFVVWFKLRVYWMRQTCIGTVWIARLRWLQTF